MPDIDKSYQELIITNFGLSPSGYTGSIGAVGATGPAGGYTGSRGDVGYVGSAGPGMSMTTDTFTGDGATTAFVLTTTPDSINRTIVNYNGVTVLRSAYTLSSATITFSSAPAAGSQIEITTINSASGSGGATGTALKITTVGYVGNNTATDTAGGETVTLTGTGFVSGASVIINGVAAGVVTVVSATQLTFTAPALAAGTYIFYVVNTDGATAISVPGISYSGVPSFYTGAGSVGTVYEASSFNSNVAAVGDSAITYTIASGSLPAGATLNANGVITGSSVLTASPTTYTFGVNASDGQNQDVVRSYTITVNPDAVTWSAPADAATVTLGQNSSTSTTLTAVSAAGKAVTYTANALPTGLSIVGGEVTGTPTVLGNTTTLLTATAASTTRTANITVVWDVAVTGEPYFAYNSLLLSGNGSNNANNNTFLDSSSNNFAITRNGNTTQGTFTPYGPNWSNYFDGVGDSISAPSVNNLIVASGDFTFECWINPGSQPGSYNTIFGGDTTGAFLFSITGSGTSTGIHINPYGSAGAYTQTYTFTQGVWYHIAATRSGTSLKVFVNGTQLGATVTDSTNYSSASRTVGGAGASNQNYLGYVSNMRLVKGTAVYTSNFTPSTTPLTAITNTSLLTCQSNRFIDNSTNAYAITASGNTNVQRFSPFSPSAAYSASTTGGSGYFDGSGNYLSAATNTAFNCGTGNFTIEAWLNISSYPGYYPLIIGNNNGTWSAGAIALTAQNFTSGGPNKISLSINDINSSGGTLVSSTTNSFNTWMHVALVRDGTNLVLYINGSPTSTTISSGVVFDWGKNGLLVGGGNWDTGLNSYYAGYISNLRLVKGTAVYTSAFTPPTAPVTAISGTSLLTNFTNAGVIDSTMQHNIETVGDAKISTTQSKFGGSSMYFDGTGDYLLTSPNPNLSFGTSDFTVEMWVYLNSGSAYQYVIGATANGGMQIGLNVPISGTPTIAVATANGSWILNFGASITIPSATWRHIAVTRSGSTNRAFINGVQLGSNITDSTNWTFPNNRLQVGATLGAEAFAGYMDDLRITKGYARYTANFTPPTTALSTQ